MSEIRTKNTVVITGINNGGTSVIGAICEALGYYMGEDKITYEDKDFQEVVRQAISGKTKEYEQFVAGRNLNNERWGYKKPCVPFQLELFQKTLHNPHFIIIFRDPVATAMRVSRNSDLTPEIIRNHTRMISEQQKELAETIENISPKLVLSYEKLLVHPERTIGEIAEFLGLDKSEQSISSIARRVKPEHGHPPFDKNN